MNELIHPALKEQNVVVQHSVNDLEKMANIIVRSNLFGMKKQEEAFALMLIAQAEGRHPASVAMDYDIIQGRTALKSQAALRRYQESGGCVKWVTRTDTKCEAIFRHPKSDDLTVTWTMDRAKALGYDSKANWKAQPMVMLTWRVVAEGVRLSYPACLSGAYLDTEVRDFSDLKTEPTETAATVTDVDAPPPPPKAEDMKKREFTELALLIKSANKKTQDAGHTILENYLTENNKSMAELNEIDYAVLCDCLRPPFDKVVK